jgi:predicted PurR-regulated permease PerM
MRLKSLESRIFMALVLATTAFFLWMVRHFLLPVFWAVVFAILFRPLYLRFHRAVGGRASAAAALSTLAVILVVAVPTSVLVTAVTQQALALYQRVVDGEVNVDAPIEFVERMLPQLTSILARYGVEVDQARVWLDNAAIASSQWMATQALNLGQNALTVTVLFALMLYLLFFFFRDGDRITQGIIRALPMGDAREERLFTRFAQVSRATVKGTIVVAIVQGTLGGILFAAVGIQGAIFWGMLMGVLSLLPAVGPALIWLPASIYFFSTGSIVRGMVVIVVGALVVGLVDNVLRPILVGRGAQLPDYLVLLATLGGLTVFGIAGFIAGPIIAALFLVMWEMFAEEYAPFDTLETLPTAADAEAVVAAAEEESVADVDPAEIP